MNAPPDLSHGVRPPSKSAASFLGKAARLFTENFSTFLPRRRVRKHVGRVPMLGGLAGAHAPAPPAQLSADLLRASAESPSENFASQ